MPSTQTQGSGIIDSFYDDDSGVIKENLTNTSYEFFQPGAKIEFTAKENVIFLKITTPSGKVIIRDIVKPN
jgi:hypothetical protein